MKHLVEKLERRFVIGGLVCNKCGEPIKGQQYSEECTTFLVHKEDSDGQVDLCKKCTQELVDGLLLSPTYED
jgi:hypothetical protein